MSCLPECIAMSLNSSIWLQMFWLIFCSFHLSSIMSLYGLSVMKLAWLLFMTSLLSRSTNDWLRRARSILFRSKAIWSSSDFLSLIGLDTLPRLMLGHRFTWWWPLWGASPSGLISLPISKFSKGEVMFSNVIVPLLVKSSGISEPSPSEDLMMWILGKFDRLSTSLWFSYTWLSRVDVFFINEFGTSGLTTS